MSRLDLHQICRTVDGSSAMTYAHICDGCGKQVDYAAAPPGLPSGWFASLFDGERPFALIVACSADCVAGAKRRHKLDEWERLGKRQRAIDDVKLERVP